MKIGGDKEGCSGSARLNYIYTPSPHITIAKWLNHKEGQGKEKPQYQTVNIFSYHPQRRVEPHAFFLVLLGKS